MQSFFGAVEVSEALQQAQAKLLSRRKALSGMVSQQKGCSEGASPALSVVGKLPAHLGWHRHSIHNNSKSKVWSPQTAPLPTISSDKVTEPPTSTFATSISLPATLGTVLLKAGKVNLGRIWLLLRLLDQTGKGWVYADEARDNLTAKKATLQVCGWRQLRKLLKAGEGIFWVYENGRIWLKSLIKVAGIFGIKRFSNGLITLPTSTLTQSIGKVRATFYATFHSSRQKQAKCGKSYAPPISRQTLTNICGISRKTQRTYEKDAGIQRQTNLCSQTISSPEKLEQMRFELGKRLIHVKQSKQSSQLIWQLPNSYITSFTKTSKQVKPLNRKLAVLFDKGKTGNGNINEQAVGQWEKRYWGTFAETKQTSMGYWRDLTADQQRGGAMWRTL